MNEPLHLFSPMRMRSLTLKNRIVLSPMCQYASEDGFANDWHLVHLGSRAVGGAGLIFTESTAVSSEGRLSPADLGIYRDEHLPMLHRITDFIRAQGAVPAIQLNHAGRKASRTPPWEGTRLVKPEQGGWEELLAPSAIPLAADEPAPRMLTHEDIFRIQQDFGQAVSRAVKAGFQLIELHGAHGYLIHQFLSPLSNQREDEYGGSFENRIRFLLELVDTARANMPEAMPLWVRLSVTDWVKDRPAWDLAQSIELARLLKAEGVDAIDCSTAGMPLREPIPVGPGYQTAFAARIRREAGIPTVAVGMITAAEQADHIIRSGQADLVALAREHLRDPYFALHASGRLGQEVEVPVRYARAFPAR